MEIKLNYTTIIEKVSRSLSIIGKRAKDQNGDSLYEAMTFGENEYPLIVDYIRSAAVNVAAAMMKFLTKRKDDGSNIVIEYTTPSSAFFAAFNESELQEVSEDYIYYYVMGRWLSVVFPTQESFYTASADSNMKVLLSMLYETTTPHTDVSLKSVNS